MVERRDFRVADNEDWRVIDLALRQAADLTGATIDLQIRRSPKSALTTLDLSSGGGSPEITIEDAGAREISIVVAQSVLAALGLGTHSYDIRVTYSSGAKQRVMTGKWSLVRGTTRD